MHPIPPHEIRTPNHRDFVGTPGSGGPASPTPRNPHPHPPRFRGDPGSALLAHALTNALAPVLGAGSPSGAPGHRISRRHWASLTWGGRLRKMTNLARRPVPPPPYAQPAMLLSELAGRVPDAVVEAGGEFEVRRLTYDSRTARAGDLFVAVAGLRVDG